jgi:hypothetical protein
MSFVLSFHMNQDDMTSQAAKATGAPFLFHPDYTVGPGVSPDLLTPPHFEEMSGTARGLYRRWGITPRPENYWQKHQRRSHRPMRLLVQVRIEFYLTHSYQTAKPAD